MGQMPKLWGRQRRPFFVVGIMEAASPVGATSDAALLHDYEVAVRFNSAPPSASQVPVWFAMPVPTLNMIFLPT